MRIVAILFSFLTLLGGFGGARQAQPQVEIDVNQGVIEPLPIAGALLQRRPPRRRHRSSGGRGPGALGLFPPDRPQRLLAARPGCDAAPRFSDWKAINAAALSPAAPPSAPTAACRWTSRLWDVAQERALEGRQFTATPDNWRRVAHKIADLIYERLTGQKGYFDTRVVFVSESGPEDQHRQAPGHHGPGRGEPKPS
jgi:TolB protein